MHTFSVAENFVERLAAYRSSREYTQVPKHSRSEYWQYHSSQMDIAVHKNEVTVRGISGYYIPPSRNQARQTSGKLRKALSDPAFLMSQIKKQMHKDKTGIRLLNFFEAFDAVINESPVADIQRHSERIDFGKISQNPSLIRSTQEMKTKFFARSKYSVNPQIVYSYYIYNILSAYVGTPSAILDIGAGNGNLASVLHHHFRSRVIIVDLPETLCLSMLYLEDVFPEAKKVLPHEASAQSIKTGDFVFLTPNQLGLVPDNMVDLSSNTFSFQEMTTGQIQEYFRFIQRVTKPGGHFFTANRIEKIPTHSGARNGQTSENINRFSDYPWAPQNETLINEVCRFYRLVQLDDIGLKLQRIRK